MSAQGVRGSELDRVRPLGSKENQRWPLPSFEDREARQLNATTPTPTPTPTLIRCHPDTRTTRVTSGGAPTRDGGPATPKPRFTHSVVPPRTYLPDT